MPGNGVLSNWKAYVGGLLLVVATTVVGHFLKNYFAPTNIAMLYLLDVVISATLWGLVPSIAVSVLGVLAFDFFLISPTLTFRVQDAQYIFTFISLAAVGILLSYTTTLLRRQTYKARLREKEVGMLYAMARRLSTSSGRENVISTIIDGAAESFNRQALLFLPEAGNKGELTMHSADTKTIIDEVELEAARRCFQNKEAAGRGTSIMPEANALFLPLVTAHAVVGVLALLAYEKAVLSDPETWRPLVTFADLVAGAIERIQLAEEANRAEVLRDSQKLQTAMLNSISHDLRTPLVSIMGALSSLEEKGLNLDEGSKASLVHLARGESERLNHLITNLLDVSRVEAEAVHLSIQSADLQEIIGVVLSRLGERAAGCRVEVTMGANLPFVLVDSSLIAQAIFNILDNALKYSPDDSTVEISAACGGGDEVAVEIADRGIGIPSSDLELVFDKFYRVQRPESVAGSGLGLAIARGLIEAHGGHINAVNRPGGGTVIHFTLPAAEGES